MERPGWLFGTGRRARGQAGKLDKWTGQGASSTRAAQLLGHIAQGTRTAQRSNDAAAGWITAAAEKLRHSSSPPWKRSGRRLSTAPIVSPPAAGCGGGKGGRWQQLVRARPCQVGRVRCTERNRHRMRLPAARAGGCCDEVCMQPCATQPSFPSALPQPTDSHPNAPRCTAAAARCTCVLPSAPLRR